MNGSPNFITSPFSIPIESGQAWELMAQDFILREKLLSQELSKKFRQELDALYSGRPRTEAYYLNARFELALTQADCTLERYFKACCEVWEAQCRTKCRAFFLAVLHFVLIPTLGHRWATFSDDILLRHPKAKAHNLRQGMRHFTKEMDKLYEKWITKIEIASRDQEHQERAGLQMQTHPTQSQTIDLPPLPSFKQGGSPGSKRPLSRGRQRDDAAPSDEGLQSTAESARLQSPREQFEAFKEEVLKQAGRRLTQEDIWTVAGYKDRTQFARFLRGGNPSSASAQAFQRIFSAPVDDFLARLDLQEKKK